LSFNLFDRTPHAWTKVTQWSAPPTSSKKRTPSRLLWSLTVHDKRAGNAPFLEGLALIERAADDDGTSSRRRSTWRCAPSAKRNPALNAAAATVARRLADSDQPAARWVDGRAEGAHGPAVRKRSRRDRPI